MIGYIELAQMLGSGALSAFLTLKKQGMEDEQRRWEMQLAGHSETEKSQRSRINLPRGTMITRRVIAIMMVLCYLAPIWIPLFRPDVAIVVGYIDTSYGWLPWSTPQDAIVWVGAGSVDASRVITIFPAMHGMINTIIGLFFGNQIAKR